MKRLIIIVCVCVAAGGITFGWFQGSNDQPKTLRSRKGTPLSELTKNSPKDVPVVVEKDQSPPDLVAPPRGMGQLEWMTSLVPVAMIIQITEMTPTLTPAQDWVTTTVHAQVEEVIKNGSPRPLAVGDSIEFSQDGGDITVDNVRVHAKVSWTENFRVDARYLVFGEYLGDAGGLRVSPQSSYQIDASDQLKSLARQGSPTRDSGVGLSSARVRIRAVKEGK